MSARTIIVIGLALFCGFSALIGITQLGRTKAKATATPVTVPIVVAKEEMSRGSVVTETSVEIKDWPQELVPVNAARNIEDVTDRVALSIIDAGDPMSSRKLADKESGRGLSALIPPGMRAYTVKVSNVASNVAGFILPGSRVDVLLTLRGGSNDETGGGTTVTLLQAVEVLAVDQLLGTPEKESKDEEPRQSNSVTLLILPDQAPVLDLGQNMGMLTLSLRNPTDVDEAVTKPATLNELLTMKRGITTKADDPPVATPPPEPVVAPLPKQEPEPEPEIYEIRTFRGNSVGRIKVIKRR